MHKNKPIARILVFVCLSLLVTLTTDFSFGQTKTGKAKSNEKINGLLKDIDNSQEGPQRVKLLLDIASEYRRGDPDKTLDYIKQALALSEKISDPKSIAKSLNTMGIYYYFQGKYPLALDYYKRSLKIKEERGDRKGSADSYYNIAIVYSLQGNYPLALEYYNRSLKIWEELGNREGIAHLYNNIGLVYKDQGNYPRALEYYFKSLKIKEELEDRKDYAITYTNIGVIYGTQGNYPRALEHYFKSLKINEELGNRSGIALNCNNIGIDYKNQGNYTLALKYLFRSLKIREGLGNKNGLAQNLYSIGVVYMEQEKYTLALEYLYKSLKLYKELGIKRGLSFTNKVIGSCYVLQGETKKGIDYLTRALKLAKTINSTKTIRDSSGHLSEAYANLKQFENAYRYHVLFKEKSDELINEEKNKKITQMEMQYEFDKKQQQVQIELQRRKTLITALIVSSVLLVLLLFFIYSRFHLKKKANIVIRAEKEKAVKANKAKSEFLANMSHELRTPLNAVIGFSQLLISKSTDKKQKSYVQSILTAGKSLLTLINDILDLSKIESGMMKIKYAPVNPRAIFNEIRHIFRDQLDRKKLEFIMDIDEKLPPLLTLDETRLRQVLLNLVGNAVKFTEHGHIKLSAKKGEVTPAGMNLIISVEDTGIGIPEEEQARIFEPFVQQSGQSTRKYGGTGLGLSICKRLTQMMKGRLTVESQPRNTGESGRTPGESGRTPGESGRTPGESGTASQGSVFTLVLKNVTVPSVEPVMATSESFSLNSISFESATLLVIDDVESNRNVLRELLNRVNLKVLTAEHGEAGLSIAEKSQPDIIITDIIMPGMDVMTVAKELKSNPKTKEIPILILSASSTVEQKDKIMESGFFTAFLEKPVDIKKLFKELSNHIPYSRTQEHVDKGTVKPDAFTGLSKDTKTRLPQLIKILEEEIVPQLEQFKGALKTEEVKNFADKIKQLGNNFKVPGLIDYANRLLELERDFDIEGIKKSLAGFQGIVNDLALQVKE